MYGRRGPIYTREREMSRSLHSELNSLISLSYSANRLLSWRRDRLSFRSAVFVIYTILFFSIGEYFSGSHSLSVHSNSFLTSGRRVRIGASVIDCCPRLGLSTPNQPCCWRIWKLEEFEEFDSMLELRQRSRSSGSSGGYQQVDTDDEMDSVPLLDLQKIKAAPTERSTICKGIPLKTPSVDHVWSIVHVPALLKS